MYKTITINTPSIQLDQFLKWAKVVQTGGEAKLLIKSGKVIVNNQIETRRGKKLKENDTVTVNNITYIIKCSTINSHNKD